MKITDVKIRKIDNGGSLRAVAEVTFNDEILVRDIRLIEGNRGWFAAMPSRKDRDGNYHNIVSLSDSAMKEQMNLAVLDAYENQENTWEEDE